MSSTLLKNACVVYIIQHTDSATDSKQLQGPQDMLLKKDIILKKIIIQKYKLPRFLFFSQSYRNMISYSLYEWQERSIVTMKVIMILIPAYDSFD